MNPTHLDPFAPVDSPLHPAYVRPPRQDPPDAPLTFTAEEFAGLASLFPEQAPDGGWEHTAAAETEIEALASELTSLYGAHATTDEVAAAEDGQGYPPLSVLRQRAAQHRADLLAARPKSNAVKAEWEAYYQLVFSTATPEDAAALTIADLKERTLLDGETDQDSAGA